VIEEVTLLATAKADADRDQETEDVDLDHLEEIEEEVPPEGTEILAHLDVEMTQEKTVTEEGTAGIEIETMNVNQGEEIIGITQMNLREVEGDLPIGMIGQDLRDLLDLDLSKDNQDR
jgi:hypothetical protein